MDRNRNRGSSISKKDPGVAHHHHQHHVHFTTHPLFPPIPIYGPPSLWSRIESGWFRFVSFFLSLTFLTVVFLFAFGNSFKHSLANVGLRLQGINPQERRPFYRLEQERKRERKEEARRWKKQQQQQRKNDLEHSAEEFVPTEGGHDKLLMDVGYYARRVGLDAEEFKVQTEDGFIITLEHVYDPREYQPLSEEERDYRNPRVFSQPGAHPKRAFPSSNRRYPVLLIHGLLQCSGAFCANDDDSLAFLLCKAGYDVWLGNNRCGMKPEHTRLATSDPRMWAWNTRHMGVLDLPAMVSRVLYETGFEKLGLVCHSQGTTQTLVALAKEQRPEIGEKLSVFCALAPAAYAGPLMERKHLRFITNLPSKAFTYFFGIHAFMPLMMTMHRIIPAAIFGDLAYIMFSFLFDWSDDRWDRGLRHRMFQFAPVYVSAETMRWWLGCDCFALHKCILTTREDTHKEDEEDMHIVQMETQSPVSNGREQHHHQRERSSSADAPITKSDTAWFGERVPPFALWVAGNDHLVDGRKLLRRFQNGREPNVRLVHAHLIEEYEHLDVLWAMDAVDRVGKEVRDVIWKTMPESAKAVCRPLRT